MAFNVTINDFGGLKTRVSDENVGFNSAVRMDNMYVRPEGIDSLDPFGSSITIASVPNTVRKSSETPIFQVKSFGDITIINNGRRVYISHSGAFEGADYREVDDIRPNGKNIGIEQFVFSNGVKLIILSVNNFGLGEIYLVAEEVEKRKSTADVLTVPTLRIDSEDVGVVGRFLMLYQNALWMTDFDNAINSFKRSKILNEQDTPLTSVVRGNTDRLRIRFPTSGSGFTAGFGFTTDFNITHNFYFQMDYVYDITSNPGGFDTSSADAFVFLPDGATENNQQTIRNTISTTTSANRIENYIRELFNVRNAQLAYPTDFIYGTKGFYRSGSTSTEVAFRLFLATDGDELLIVEKPAGYASTTIPDKYTDRNYTSQGFVNAFRKIFNVDEEFNSSLEDIPVVGRSSDPIKSESFQKESLNKIVIGSVDYKNKTFTIDYKWSEVLFKGGAGKMLMGNNDIGINHNGVTQTIQNGSGRTTVEKTEVYNNYDLHKLSLFKFINPEKDTNGVAFNDEPIDISVTQGEGSVLGLAVYNGDIYSFKNDVVYRTQITSENTIASHNLFRRSIGVRRIENVHVTAEGILFIDESNPAQPIIRILTKDAEGESTNIHGFMGDIDFSDYSFEKSNFLEHGDQILINTGDGKIIIYNKVNGQISISTQSDVSGGIGLFGITSDGENVYILRESTENNTLEDIIGFIDTGYGSTSRGTGGNRGMLRFGIFQPHATTNLLQKAIHSAEIDLLLTEGVKYVKLFLINLDEPKESETELISLGSEDYSFVNAKLPPNESILPALGGLAKTIRVHKRVRVNAPKFRKGALEIRCLTDSDARGIGSPSLLSINYAGKVRITNIGMNVSTYPPRRYT